MFFTLQPFVIVITSQKFFVFCVFLLFLCLGLFQQKKVLVSVQYVATWFPCYYSVTWKLWNKWVATHFQATYIFTSQILCCDVIFHFVAYKSRHYWAFFSVNFHWPVYICIVPRHYKKNMVLIKILFLQNTCSYQKL